VPTPQYVECLKTVLHGAIDAGVTAIHLEEPEFWVASGYSEAFKHAWREEYGEPWQPPHSSVEARYRSGRLKQKLYTDCLAELFRDAKAYARRKGRGVRCFVPTHSLINYAHRRIVSPEGNLMAIAEADGYIAQVWTGTARTPNIYRGRRRATPTFHRSSGLRCRCSSTASLSRWCRSKTSFGLGRSGPIASRS